MFLGYKSATKDIDLVFANAKERDIFIDAIDQLGYKERALFGVYDEEHQKRSGKPRMFTRGDERFDLFVKDVFGFDIDFNIDVVSQRIDFIGKHSLIVHVLPVDQLILLKALTNRDKDHEDIESILKIEKTLDWEKIISIAASQKNRNKWILIDLEETMQKLKDKTFIKSELFEKLYKLQDTK
jgi:hypothetical protein